MKWGILAAAFLLAGCAVQRAHQATEAREQLVGLSKEQILACMGPPGQRMAEGATEVWSYASGNGHISTLVNTSSNTTFHGGTSSASSTGFGTAISSRRYCTVNVTIVGGKVQRVNYLGPTGGLLTQGEQCAYAVKECLPKQ